MDNKYYLPSEMSTVLEACYRDNQIPSNLRLLLHKHVPVRVIEKSVEKQDNAKTAWLRNIASQYKANAELVKAARYRWQSYIDALKASFVSMPIDWRMVVGLGGNSVFETDITLHLLYGLPIIPGSALKGLTRAWVETEKNDTTRVPGPAGKPISRVERIFGNQRKEETQHTGSVIFFDAIVMNENFRLALDIMNPHYTQYYQEGKPPSNDQNPVPVPFLTVMGATFLFAIAPRNPFNEEQKSDAQTALQWLQQALAEYGIGSKTSSGYGYMEERQQYKRPERLSVFKVGDPITGKCMYKNTVSTEVRAPLAAPQVLQYRDFKLDEVLIAVIDDDKVTTLWQPNTEHTCSFLYEQIRDNCTVLVCKPSETSAAPATSGKKKNKKAKDKKDRAETKD